MARLKQVVIDAQDPPRLARFWADALEGFEVRPYDDAEIERLASLGLTPDSDPVVLVDGPGLELCFQKVAVVGAHKRSLHLDLWSDQRTNDVIRMVGLGATIHEDFETHTWMCDPEGNDFCIVD